MNKKIAVMDINGKKVKEIEAPPFLYGSIREDLVSKIIENKKRVQPYSPSPVAGKQHAASGKIVHRRHVWRSGYGRGQSRIPRKIISRKGSQFGWIGAEVASTRGGRRAHPPKAESMIKFKKVNKKEATAALISALSATADIKKVAEKYEKINERDIKELPIVVESEITKLKTKDLLSSLKKILGEKLFSIAVSKKRIRGGRGKRRGRKYKKNAGIIFIIGKKEKMQTKAIEVKNAENLSLTDLAAGGLGRLALYTEQAIKDLEERLEKKRK